MTKNISQLITFWTTLTDDHHDCLSLMGWPIIVAFPGFSHFFQKLRNAFSKEAFLVCSCRSSSKIVLFTSGQDFHIYKL